MTEFWSVHTFPEEDTRKGGPQRTTEKNGRVHFT